MGADAAAGKADVAPDAVVGAPDVDAGARPLPASVVVEVVAVCPAVRGRPGVAARATGDSGQDGALQRGRA